MTFVPDTRAAEAYDRWFDRGWGKYTFGAEAKALLKAAGPLKGKRILDVGSGTGQFTAEVAREGRSVIGLDRDASMLTVAMRRLGGSLVLGDAAKLPFADSCFDIAFAVTVCEFVDNIERVFGELARVTRPNGRFVVGSLNPRSAWGLFGRGRFQHAPWTNARFLARRELLRLGSQYGDASLSSALYAPENVPFPQVAGPALELIGRLAPGLGAFQILVVDLTTTKA